MALKSGQIFEQEINKKFEEDSEQLISVIRSSQVITEGEINYQDCNQLVAQINFTDATFVNNGLDFDYSKGIKTTCDIVSEIMLGDYSSELGSLKNYFVEATTYVAHGCRKSMIKPITNFLGQEAADPIVNVIHDTFTDLGKKTQSQTETKVDDKDKYRVGEGAGEAGELGKNTEKIDQGKAQNRQDSLLDGWWDNEINQHTDLGEWFDQLWNKNLEEQFNDFGSFTGKQDGNVPGSSERTISGSLSNDQIKWLEQYNVPSIQKLNEDARLKGSPYEIVINPGQISDVNLGYTVKRSLNNPIKIDQDYVRWDLGTYSEIPGLSETVVTHEGLWFPWEEGNIFKPGSSVLSYSDDSSIKYAGEYRGQTGIDETFEFRGQSDPKEAYVKENIGGRLSNSPVGYVDVAFDANKMYEVVKEIQPIWLNSGKYSFAFIGEIFFGPASGHQCRGFVREAMKTYIYRGGKIYLIPTQHSESRPKT